MNGVRERRQTELGGQPAQAKLEVAVLGLQQRDRRPRRPERRLQAIASIETAQEMEHVCTQHRIAMNKLKIGQTCIVWSANIRAPLNSSTMPHTQLRARHAAFARAGHKSSRTCKHALQVRA